MVNLTILNDLVFQATGYTGYWGSNMGLTPTPIMIKPQTYFTFLALRFFIALIVQCLQRLKMQMSEDLIYESSIWDTVRAPLFHQCLRSPRNNYVDCNVALSVGWILLALSLALGRTITNYFSPSHLFMVSLFHANNYF